MSGTLRFSHNSWYLYFGGSPKWDEKGPGKNTLQNIPRYRYYWLYTVATAIAWVVVLALIHMANGAPVQSLLLVFLGFCLCWVSTTIARYLCPPPKRWSAQQQEKMPPYRNYWIYSLGLAVIWAVVLALAQASGGGVLVQPLLSFFFGFGIAWISATVARYTYPPPKRWAGSPTQYVPAPTPVDSRPAFFSSGLGSGALPPLTLGLVSCGGVGALLFTATYVVEGLTRPGYAASQ